MSSGNKYKAISNKLKFEGRAFINGKYVNAIDGKKFETINPATGKKLCAVANVIIKMLIWQLKFPEKLSIAEFGLRVHPNIEKRFY